MITMLVTCPPFMVYSKIVSVAMICSILITFASLSSEKASIMMPNTMFRPIVVMMIKKVTSKKNLFLAISEVSESTSYTTIRQYSVTTEQWKIRITGRS